MKNILAATLGLLSVLTFTNAHAWDPGAAQAMQEEADVATAEMLENDASMQRFFDSAVGWVIIPSVGKAGFGIGGARGKGVLYEGGSVTANVTLTQLSIGWQAGAQAYSEFIFFENEAALTKFKNGNYELGAQASAVAITAGASVDAGYSDGVAIFTRTKGGLMYEASVGGQKFSVDLKE
jgi:lipid-binding SYLF domain-containing protein